MKNFPHQYNDFSKLRQTLRAVRDLEEAAKDVMDDAVLGYDLARRGIYTFRNLSEPLEERVAAEQEKPPSQQGAQTAAREMRRTLQHLGWLGTDFEITPAGEALLSSAPGSPAEQVAWQQALMGLSLVQDGDESHPVRILLRLVSDTQVVARRGLELALEARDDSEREYERIRALLNLPYEERLASIGASPYKAANAVKILPAFAEQANLIHRSSPRAPYVLTEAGLAALVETQASGSITLRPSATPARRRARGVRRQVDPAALLTPSHPDSENWSVLSPEEQVSATRLRFERTARHQEVVRALAELFSQDAQLFDDPSAFDLVVVPNDVDLPVALVEVKTLNGDAPTQARLAVGQLLAYEYFNVRSGWPDREVVLLAVFDAAIAGELAEFLDHVGIGAFAWRDDTLEALNQTGREIHATLALLLE